MRGCFRADFISNSQPKHFFMPMQENYLHELLVQYLYHDLMAEEAEETVRHLENDRVMREQFNQLLTAKSLLPKARFNPAPAVLTNILQYSTKTALEARL